MRRTEKPSAQMLDFWRSIVANENAAMWDRCWAVRRLKRAGVDVTGLRAAQVRPEPAPRIATVADLQALWRTWASDERMPLPLRRKALSLLTKSGGDVRELAGRVPAPRAAAVLH
jgi:hypothetical protein